MILVLLGIFILIFIVCATGCFGLVDFEESGLCILGGVTSFLCGATSIIVAICITATVSSGLVIDSKIEMYQQENTEIECKVETAVKAYLDYEGKTYEELKIDGESIIAVATAYPDLASSELVKAQIDLYTNNTALIRDLKNEKLDLSVYKWWLYFG